MAVTAPASTLAAHFAIRSGPIFRPLSSLLGQHVAAGAGLIHQLVPDSAFRVRCTRHFSAFAFLVRPAARARPLRHAALGVGIHRVEHAGSAPASFPSARARRSVSSPGLAATVSAAGRSCRPDQVWKGFSSKFIGAKPGPRNLARWKNSMTGAVVVLPRASSPSIAPENAPPPRGCIVSFVAPFAGCMSATTHGSPSRTPARACRWRAYVHLPVRVLFLSFAVRGPGVDHQQPERRMGAAAAMNRSRLPHPRSETRPA